jgi:CheY-like chemotaxis protein
VIVADPDEERGKRSAVAIGRWGLEPHLVHDGVEAMLAIQRLLPRAVVLDAALPKMFGFQVCEIVKRNESLRNTTVVLVGPIDDRDRGRQDPSDRYGADAVLEPSDLPEGLLPSLRSAGMPIREVKRPDDPRTRPSSSPVGQAPPGPTSTPEGSGAPPAPIDLPPVPVRESGVDDAAPASGPVPPEPAPVGAQEDPERSAEREHAERLARIAVSEMLLYQPEKFDQASRAGNLEQVLDLEIQEARALLRQRISEEVRNEKDFILEELDRVAAERMATG